MAKFDLSVVRKQVNEALDKDSLKDSSTVKYVDVNDPNCFVVMPEWFKTISTIPGLPFGYIVEFVGLPNAGKTTAGIIALVNAQQQGHIALLVDVEKKFPYDRFVAMGGSIDPNDLQVISEPTIEENFNVLEFTQKAIHQEYPTAKMIVVYDSVAVGSTRADMAKSTLEAQVMADQAKVLKRMLRRQVVHCWENNCVFVAINQMHGNPNPMAHGKPTISGGKGLEYAKALSISFKNVGKLPVKTVNGMPFERGTISQMQTTKNHLQQGDLSLAKALLHITATEMIPAGATVKKGKKGKNGKDVEVAIVEGGEEVELDDEDESAAE